MKRSPPARVHVMVLLIVAGALGGCGPAGPGASDAPAAMPSGSGAAPLASPLASPFPDPTLVLPTVKPGSSERPILTLEPPPPVEP